MPLAGCSRSSVNSHLNTLYLAGILNLKKINSITSKKTHIFDFWKIIHNSKKKLKTINYYEIGEI